MDDAELEALLVDLESDRVERKSSLTAGENKERVCQAICAFANDLPNHRKAGVVFIGATDDGRRAGLRVTDDLLQTLAHLRSDGNILPFPSMTVQKKTLCGCELAVIEVQPSDAPPARYQGRTWIRIGSRRALATAEEERRLSEKRRAKDLPFDLRPVAAADLDDFDLGLFEQTILPASVPAEVLQRNQRNAWEQLVSLRFLSAGDPPKPTVLGLLVLGQDPRQFVPCAYVQFLRIDGLELTDAVRDQDEIAGPLPSQLLRIDEKMRAHVSVVTDVTSGSIEHRHPDYPLVALQQLVRNAVMHRTYEATNAPVRVTWFSDRIEILNPGGPFGQVTRENFGRPGITDYRNPHLAGVMKDLGYVQRFGIGIPLARQELARNRNPAPEFVPEDTHVLVIVRRRT